MAVVTCHSDPLSWFVHSFSQLMGADEGQTEEAESLFRTSLSRKEVPFPKPHSYPGQPMTRTGRLGVALLQSGKILKNHPSSMAPHESGCSTCITV